MYRSGGSVKFIFRTRKFYKAITLGIGRKRYSRATFKRSRDAIEYSHKLTTRINRFMQGGTDGTRQEIL